MAAMTPDLMERFNSYGGHEAQHNGVAWCCSARRKLLTLHAATELRQMAVPPGNRLEALKGHRNGQHSIRINDQWRICFRWREGNASDVQIVDDH
jgi:plasmid maintenance system killer protein